MGVQLNAYDYATIQTRYNERFTHRSCWFIGYRSRAGLLAIAQVLVYWLSLKCWFIGYRSSETVQKTSLGYAGGKPNPLNPPYQGDFPLNSPLIRGLSTQFPPDKGAFHSNSP